MKQILVHGSLWGCAFPSSADSTTFG